MYGVIYQQQSEDVEPEAIATVVGSWVGFVDIDKTRYWDIRSQKPEVPKEVANPMPSDSRFREDEKFLAEKDYDRAQA